MNTLLNQVYIIATVCLLICLTPLVRKAKWLLFGHRNVGWHQLRGLPPKPWFEYRMKPFDCPLCLTFWSSLAIDGYLYSVPEAIGMASVNALIASELEKYLRK